MEFKDITIEDKDEVLSFLRFKPVADCYSCFTNMFLWRKSYPVQICRKDGFLMILMSDDEDKAAYLPPLGEGDFGRMLPLIENDARERGVPPVYITTDESVIARLRTIYPDYGVLVRRSQSDYVYLRESLATLAGKRHQQKRNHVNKFKSLYQYTYAPLRKEDKDECLQLLKEWKAEKISVHNVPGNFLESFDNEENSIREAFDNFDRLELLGGTIRIDGQVVAFCYGSAISDDTFCTHIEKALESYEGIFAVINQEFAKHIPEKYRYVNREEDLGIQGLRKSKESYCPDHYVHKYVFSRLTPEMLQVRDLWLKCFVRDTPEDSEQFLLSRFKTENMFSEYRDGRIVSMLHVIPFGDVAYIYAVATDPEYRCQGISAALMDKALQQCRQKGFKEAVLIPDSEKLRERYAKAGFSGQYKIRFNTVDEFNFFAICDDYDYGTGCESNDLAMICPLSADAVVHNPEEILILSDL